MAFIIAPIGSNLRSIYKFESSVLNHAPNSKYFASNAVNHSLFSVGWDSVNIIRLRLTPAIWLRQSPVRSLKTSMFKTLADYSVVRFSTPPSTRNIAPSKKESITFGCYVKCLQFSSSFSLPQVLRSLQHRSLVLRTAMCIALFDVLISFVTCLFSLCNHSPYPGEKAIDNQYGVLNWTSSKRLPNPDILVITSSAPYIRSFEPDWWPSKPALPPWLPRQKNPNSS